MMHIPPTVTVTIRCFRCGGSGYFFTNETTRNRPRCCPIKPTRTIALHESVERLHSGQLLVDESNQARKQLGRNICINSRVSGGDVAEGVQLRAVCGTGRQERERVLQQRFRASSVFAPQRGLRHLCVSLGAFGGIANALGGSASLI